jgi:hypothetical protein
MTGDEGRQVFEAMLPQEEIARLCQRFGVMARQRKLNRGMVVRAMVLSAGPPGGAYQADVLRSSLEFEGPHVARSACSRWFDEPVEQGMDALAQRALAYARAPPVEWSGPRGGVQEWSSVDSTTVTGRDALREDLPGTGDDAAIKGHNVLSVGGGAPVQSHFSPAREHASRPLTIAESWRGGGLLVDRGDARRARLRAGEAHGVPCVLRLQDNWTPTVDSVARGQLTQECFPGTALAALREGDLLGLDRRAIAADVHGGPGPQARPRRLVGVHTPNGSWFVLTHLPPRMGPRQVGDLYRGRWEVERRIRLDQSVNRVEAIDAARPCSVKTRLPAARLASTIAAIRAHTHNGHTRPPQAGAPRTEAPRHPRRLALPLAGSCQSIAQAFELQGAEATQRWRTMAEWLTHAGRDPNWRRRPSLFDQLRGWKRQPLTRKEANSGDVTPGNFKVAA